jgi:hypothetical protein
MSDARPISEGDILLANWGYEANNPQFFKVLKRTAKQVTLMQMKDKRVSNDNHYLGGGYVVPTDEPATWSLWWNDNPWPDDERKPVIIKKKVHADSEGIEHIELAYYAWAFLWDYKPAHEYNYH